MKPLVFSITKIPEQKYVQLSPYTNDLTTVENIWKELTENVGQEEALSYYPLPILHNRWQQGRAAIAVANNKIISYISVIPIFDKKFKEKINLTSPIPEIEMYEFATGWTKPNWRHKGISLQLRHNLMNRFSLNAPKRFYISVTIGTGASYVLSGLDWQLVAWQKIPFTSSLMGIPTNGLENILQTINPEQVQQKMYEGDHISPQQNKTHNWDDFCYFWVSDLSLANKLNEQLSISMNENLKQWRETIITKLYRNSLEHTRTLLIFS